VAAKLPPGKAETLGLDASDRAARGLPRRGVRPRGLRGPDGEGRPGGRGDGPAGWTERG